MLHPPALLPRPASHGARWPFGRGLRRRQLPTTLAELEQQQAAAAADSHTARLLGWVL